MKTINYRFDLYTLHYSQSLSCQGFSHYLPVTQNTYTSHQTPIFVQHSTSSPFCHRYTYALNNPLKYKDPSGELVWIIPTIGWSKEGGFSFGITVGDGFPGGGSIQFELGYNFGQHVFYGFVSGTVMFNTVYASFTSNGGFHVGYTAGLSLYSGVPISTNFLTVGIDYDVTNNRWSGNVSAFYYSQHHWTFNPSVNVMLFPERTTNLARGQGFRTNDEVLQRFAINGQYNEALNYFGFEGKFEEWDPIDFNEEGDIILKYTGKTDMHGEIHYSTRAFESFDELYATYMKERYHSKKIEKGLTLNSIEAEDALGFKHAYKSRGLYPQRPLKSYQSGYDYFNMRTGFQLPPWKTNWFDFIYAIPRKW